MDRDDGIQWLVMMDDGMRKTAKNGDFDGCGVLEPYIVHGAQGRTLEVVISNTV